MKKVILGLAFALLVVSGAQAQPTIYKQGPSSVTCTIATLECRVPLLPVGGGNNYVIGEGNSTLSVGAHFNPTISGTFHEGHITEIITPFPVEGEPSGAFSFTWATDDGLTGAVSGQGHWIKPGKWPFAEIDSSTMTVNN